MIEKVRRGLRLTLARLENLPLWAEIALFGLIVIAAAAVRWQALHLVPGYVWSKDAPGYAQSAYHWVDTGEWIFDGRRGPVYSMFIGYVAKFFGGMPGVMYVQHLLAFLGIVGTCAAARLYFGRRAAWIIAAGGIAFALYGPPVHYAHLIRNETLLFFCACVALAAWAVAMKRASAGWLALAGLSAGILTLTKNVFLPFPIMAALATLWILRARPLAAVTHALILIVAFLTPFALDQWHKRTARVVYPSEPQAGILLYGRVGQWTVLDGGIEPELKAEIRQMIEDYRKLPKLDNNIILKTAVVRLKDILYARGETPSDVNRLCKSFALEAIRAEPWAYTQQVMGDVRKILFNLGDGSDSVEKEEVQSSVVRLENTKSPHPLLRAEENISRLNGLRGDWEKTLEKPQKLAWLFRHSPVFVSLLSVLALLILTPSNQRVMWLGQAALIGFTLVLLSTVGRPLQRYLVPIMPVIYWVITGMLVYLVQLLSRWAAGPEPENVQGRARQTGVEAGVRG